MDFLVRQTAAEFGGMGFEVLGMSGGCSISYDRNSAIQSRLCHSTPKTLNMPRQAAGLNAMGSWSFTLETLLRQSDTVSITMHGMRA